MDKEQRLAELRKLCRVASVGRATTPLTKGVYCARNGAWQRKYRVEYAELVAVVPGVVTEFAVALRFLGLAYADGRVKLATKRSAHMVERRLRVHSMDHNPELQEILKGGTPEALLTWNCYPVVVPVDKPLITTPALVPDDYAPMGYEVGDYSKSLEELAAEAKAKSTFVASAPVSVQPKVPHIPSLGNLKLAEL